MSGKNDRLILGGLIAIAVIAVAGAATAFGYGAYVYVNGQPTASAPTAKPSPAPTPSTVTPVAVEPFSITIISDRAGRTYEMTLGLAPGAEAIDMRRVTAMLQYGGINYSAWDFSHGEGRWGKNANGDALLERGETFLLNIYAPQAGLPFGASGPVKLILLVDAVPVSSTNVTAV